MEEQVMRQANQVEEKSLSFKDILHIIRKHILGIIVFIALGVGAGVGYTVVEAPEYVATATVLASPEIINTTTAAEYNGMSMLAETFVSFVKENAVINEVVENIKADYPEATARDVKAGMSVSNDNLIIKVTFSSDDPEKSVKYANAIVDGVVTISSLTEGNDASGNPIYKYKLLGGNLEGLSPAEKGVKKSHAIKNVGIGGAAGLVIAALYVVIFELLDNSFRSEEELEQELNLPILSTIPYYNFDDEEKKGGK